MGCPGDRVRGNWRLIGRRFVIFIIRRFAVLKPEWRGCESAADQTYGRDALHGEPVNQDSHFKTYQCEVNLSVSEPGRTICLAFSSCAITARASNRARGKSCREPDGKKPTLKEISKC